MKRRAFLRRMAFAAAACAFLDVASIRVSSPLDQLEEGTVVAWWGSDGAYLQTVGAPENWMGRFFEHAWQDFKKSDDWS